MDKRRKKGFNLPFWKKEKPRAKLTQLTYDRQAKKPVIRASICTGEQVAGFKDLKTGRFEEIMLIRNGKDLEDFKAAYGIADHEISKEW